MFSIVVWIVFDAVLVLQEVESVKDDFDLYSSRFYGYWRVAGALIELWSVFLAFLLIFVSLCFRNWEFRDILTNGRRAKTLSELISALRKDRSRAIRLCAKLKNASAILSNHDSCAFTERGEGEFEIDEKMMVRDLQGCLQRKCNPCYCAIYKFGVNYYGEPVMADANGNVRKLKYPCERQSSTLHVAGSHEFGLKYIMELPSKGLHVGSRLKQQML